MRHILVSYTVRILSPHYPEGEYPPNELMDEALRTVEASMEYRDNLRRLINDRFVRGIDSLGASGFVVEVINDAEEY